MSRGAHNVITADEAARTLLMSRAGFNRLAEERGLWHAHDGDETWFDHADILELRTEIKAGRRQALEGMVREAEEMGLYDDEDLRETLAEVERMKRSGEKPIPWGQVKREIGLDD